MSKVWRRELKLLTETLRNFELPVTQRKIVKTNEIQSNDMHTSIKLSGQTMPFSALFST